MSNLLKKKTKDFKFPNHGQYGKDDAVIFCPNKRIISLYNQEMTPKRKSMSAGVKQWFIEKAKERGWIACRPIREVETRKGAGCILLNPNVIKIENHMILIPVSQTEK